MATEVARQIDSADMPKLKVFISYSRKDAAFAEELFAGLEACGFDPFLDKQDIAAAEDWEARLRRLILEADTVVFVLSPDAVASPRCAWEVDETARLSKRIVPVVWRPVEEAAVPERLKRLNYIFFDRAHGFGVALAQLSRALNLDLDWIREHTRLGELAARWQARGRAEALLIRGDDLQDAKSWLVRHPEGAPEPTISHQEFLAASDKSESDRLSKEKATLETIAAEQKARARFQRRNYWLLGGLWAAGAGIFALVILQSADAYRNQSRVMSSLAQRALDEGLHDRAMRIALLGLPEPGALPWKPWSELAELKLGGAALLSPFKSLIEHGAPGFPVNFASFTPDGRSVATGTVDSIRLWDFETGALKREFSTRIGLLSPATFSNDGRRLLGGLNDRTALVWNTETGAVVAALRGHSGGIISARFSPDGQRVVTASEDKTARIWNAETGASLATLPGHTGTVRSAIFSPNGQQVATASEDGTARIFEAQSGRELFALSGHGATVNSASFSFDGQRLVTASLDRSARLWNVLTGQQIGVLSGHDNAVVSAVFSPDGQLIATASYDYTARLWDGATGASLDELYGHRGIVASVAFSPDGRRLVTSSYDHTARLWAVEKGALLGVLNGHSAGLNTASFSMDGRHVVTASDDKTARVWDSEAALMATSLKVRSPDMLTARLSPDGRRLVAAMEDNTVRVLEVDGTKSIGLTGHKDTVRSAAFSADGSRIATASDDGTVRVWDAANGAEKTRLTGHEGGIGELAFSSDGSRVASASDDRTAKVWDAVTGKLISSFEGHEQAVTSVGFSPDGSRIVTASADNTAAVWNASSGLRQVVLSGHESTVASASFSKDGRRVVTASHDQTARIWNATDGNQLAVLKGHTDWVLHAAFSDDDAAVVSASTDDTLRLWSPASGTRIATLDSDDKDTTKTFYTDGRRWIVLSRAGTVRVWTIDPRKVERGQKLRDLVCRDKLTGAQQITSSDVAADDLILDQMQGANVCIQYGPLSVEYWRKRLAALSGTSPGTSQPKVATK